MPDGSRIFKNPKEFEYYQQMWDQLRQTIDIVGFTSQVRRGSCVGMWQGREISAI